MNVKGLRVAAWLLIVHIAIVLALTAFAQGSADIGRIALMIALAAGAVTALFKPRGKGWLAVVAYVVYMLVQQALHLGGYVSGPAWPTQPFVAKFVMIAVLAAHSALAVIALVLTLLPGNFAAFKANAPAGAAGAEPKA